MGNLFRCGAGSSDKGTQVYYLGTGSQFDIKALIPDVDYTKLTTSNFIVGVSAIKGGNTSQVRATSTSQQFMARLVQATPYVSYSSSSGMLYINNISQNLILNVNGSQIANQVQVFHTFAAYLVVGTIENVTL